MWTFILVLILVFTAVDLIVKYLVDPLASKKWKKNKLIGSKEKAVNTPIVKIGATMYDGGMNKSGEDVNRKTYTSNLDKDSPKN
jgi:hypothetical protein